MARGRGKSPPAAAGAGETRQDIVSAARRLFMEHGFRAVSTRQIADDCGLTQPALYRHFADKRALYEVVLMEELDTMRAGLERIAARGTNVAEQLRQVIRFLPGAEHDLAQMFHDISHELDDAARGRLQMAFEQSMVAPLTSIFAAGIRQGALRAPERGGIPPATAAYLLLGMLQGTGRRGARESTTQKEQRATAIVQVMLHGLLAPGAADDPAYHPM